MPWFILLFCLAALVKSWFVNGAAVFSKLTELGHLGLAATLFLIGTGLTARTIKQAGARVMLQGVLLWIFVAVASLIVIRVGWVHL